MRYRLAEGTYIIGKFDTGSTVTISLYKLSDGSSVTLTSASCTEIGTTGIFRWNTSNITTQPTVLTEYAWVMSDGTENQYGKLVLGGYPDQIDQSLSDMEDNIRGTDDDDLKTLSDQLDAAQTDLDNPGQYKADVSNLDAAVSSRSSHSAADVWADSDAVFMLKIITNKKSLIKTGAVWQLIIYDNDDTTPILTKDLKDKNGININDIAAGILAQELKSSV